MVTAATEAAVMVVVVMVEALVEERGLVVMVELAVGRAAQAVKVVATRI